MRKDYLGIAAACASSCIGGASVVATRAVVPLLDPATLAALRFGIGAVCLAVLVQMLRRGWPRRADLALYYAKTQGRDRVEIFNPSRHSGLTIVGSQRQR